MAIRKTIVSIPSANMTQELMGFLTQEEIIAVLAERVGGISAMQYSEQISDDGNTKNVTLSLKTGDKGTDLS